LAEWEADKATADAFDAEAAEVQWRLAIQAKVRRLRSPFRYLTVLTGGQVAVLRSIYPRFSLFSMQTYRIGRRARVILLWCCRARVMLVVGVVAPSFVSCILSLYPPSQSLSRARVPSQADGLAGSIGVADFPTVASIEALVAATGVAPQVKQHKPAAAQRTHCTQRPHNTEAVAFRVSKSIAAC